MRLEPDGCALLPRAIDGDLLERLRSEAPPVARGGLRRLFDRMPDARRLCDQPRIRATVERVLGAGARPVRSILFDKAPGRNWVLSLHADTTIAVAARIETAGFGPWSIKEGVHHVTPPRGVLEAMLTVRVHLDDADVENGCLLVVPGSHEAGAPARGEPVPMPARAGDAVLMRPLVLHGSGRNDSTRHRRVLHVEFAAADLPGGLCWADA